MNTRWRGYKEHLERVYGKSVYRIGIDAGFSCPNRNEWRQGGCAFCDGTGASAIYQRTQESSFTRSSAFNETVSKSAPLSVPSVSSRCVSIKEQIARGKVFLKRRYKAEQFSAYFQAWTNTYDDVETLRCLYDAALKEGPFTELIISTRPDCVSEEILDLLESYTGRVRKVWVELGLQSANDATLDMINRGHGVNSYLLAAKALHSRGIGVCTHVIIGLMGESSLDYVHTAQIINEAESEAVKIHNLDVCGGTRVHDWYLSGEMSVACSRRHVENCITFLRHLQRDIVVERLMCETPQHRLVAPRSFPDKNSFLLDLYKTMEKNDVRQGDLT